jgi:hypothetical protein
VRDLHNRFRATQGGQFLSAFWELYLHELFSRLGFTPEVHPDSGNGTPAGFPDDAGDGAVLPGGGSRSIPRSLPSVGGHLDESQSERASSLKAPVTLMRSAIPFGSAAQALITPNKALQAASPVCPQTSPILSRPDSKLPPSSSAQADSTNSSSSAAALSMIAKTLSLNTHAQPTLKLSAGRIDGGDQVKITGTLPGPDAPAASWSYRRAVSTVSGG